jgi:hypothetical protein
MRSRVLRGVAALTRLSCSAKRASILKSGSNRSCAAAASLISALSATLGLLFGAPIFILSLIMLVIQKRQLAQIISIIGNKETNFSQMA